MIRNSRSQNLSLSIGAVEGSVRFIRPAAADGVDAAEEHAQKRSQVLHTSHYGSMGITANSIARIADARPDATLRDIY